MRTQKNPFWKRLLYTTQPPADATSRVRQVLNNAVLHLHPTYVPISALRFTYTWGLGGTSAALALLLGLTGILLMFQYDPSIERAYLSIQKIETQVVFGSLVRGIHHWSANLLVVSTFLHLLRVFFTGGYKKKRTTNWLIGLFLLTLVLASNFTGYLLPWDQLAYWAVTVSTSLLSYIPILGKEISNFFLGGSTVGQGTLRNFYAFHVAFLPVLTTAMMGYHFWKIRKNGGISQPEEAEARQTERVTTIPHLTSRELSILIFVIVVILLMGMWLPTPLEEIANPNQSPNPAKAAWYFLGLQELLLHMDPLAAILLVGTVFFGMVLIPLWDNRGENIGIYFRSKTGRRVALFNTILAIDLIPLLVIADEYWFNLPDLFPNVSPFVGSGIIPLAITFAGLLMIYLLSRLVFKANHSEGLLGVFTFTMVSLLVLTLIGNFFRGINMALVLPF